ncbi:hypothetical protein SLA2020_262030 [Shorea laevis]
MILAELELKYTVRAWLEYSFHSPNSNILYDPHLCEKSKYMDDDERPRSTTLAPVEAILLKKLKDDLERLPEDHGTEEFSDVPVEGFGAALLVGCKWHKGFALCYRFA